MQGFSDKFLKDIIRFDTEVLDIRRDEATSMWFITVEDKRKGSREILEFSRVVLCTGGCSTPKVPGSFAPAVVQSAGFRGPVIHSKYFAAQLDTILETIPPTSPDGTLPDKSIVIIGGGKSAQDMAAYLVNEGRKVTLVFETIDAFLASPAPLPEYIRKSRLLSIMSGCAELPSGLERFMHNTWFGSKITHFFWWALSRSSFRALSIPRDSPLRNVRSLFWTLNVNDEGVPQENRFHALVNKGKIEAISPARVEGFGPDGESIALTDGRTVKADLVLLATGYSSSWAGILDEDTAELLGIHRHALGEFEFKSVRTPYHSLATPPASSMEWAASIYNGIVPAKNIARRDFAVNGAIFTANMGYTCEVIAHWVSSYFLGDNMDIPKTPEEAYQHTERNAAWIRRRYPGTLTFVNESYTADIAFWTYPQHADRLLEQMGLQSMRSGGNWFTWPFKAIDSEELKTLAEERSQRRA
ncbi:FAD/NAD-P-binding domain-containing protein [Mycena galericulata]|nr:FAD/NAD-P-binding domain-containing protein [Mycena galericulata]